MTNQSSEKSDSLGQLITKTLHAFVFAPREKLITGHYHVRRSCASCHWNPSPRHRDVDICYACGDNTVPTVGRYISTIRYKNLLSSPQESVVFERKRRL